MADLGLAYDVLDQQFDSEMLTEQLGSPEGSEDELSDNSEPKYSPLEKVFLYSKSDLTAHRIWVAKELPNLIHDIDIPEALEYVIPLLYELGSDNEDKVREIFAENLDQVLLYFYKACPPNISEGSANVHQLMPNAFSLLLRTLILEWNNVIATAAQNCLLSVAKQLPKDLVEQEIIYGVLIQLGNGEGCLRPEEKDQGKTVMLKIIAMLVGFVDLDSIINVFVPTLAQVVHDTTFGVRKEIPAAIGAIIKVVTDELAVEVLLPLFEQLASDDIWQVRKSCALVLPDICASVPISAQLEKCLPIFETMVGDVSRWVQTCVEDGIGRMIAIFEGREVPEALIDKYMSLFPNKNSIRDPDRTLRCAYNFPAVLMTLGPNRWSEFAEDYVALCRDTQMSVRRTLAYSLHEVAKLLKDSSDICDRQLAPLFGFFMMDTDEIRIGVLQNAAAFLECLSPSAREMYLPVLEDIWEAESKNWRVRESVAQQLPALCDIYQKTTVVDTILPIAVKCLNDSVSRVRETAVFAIPIIYKQSKDDPDLSSKVFETILQFGLASSFRDRMIFVQICQALLKIGEMDINKFGEVLMSVLNQLGNDKVVNVRLSVARAAGTLITNIYENKQPQCSPKLKEQLESLVRRLRKDADTEVKMMLSDAFLRETEFVITDSPSPLIKEAYKGSPSQSAAQPNGHDFDHVATNNTTHQNGSCEVDGSSEAPSNATEEQIKNVVKQTETMRVTEPMKITRVVSASSDSKPLDLVDSSQPQSYSDNNCEQNSKINGDLSDYSSEPVRILPKGISQVNLEY
ncbi:hypothetical protein K7432_010973 [Basidiobolus ranarum]|uniref:Uncharacterized protein n=1 Tax=Basidiobolus ranarum TaxID=34480 RepID=A0ABR2WMW4_9FUNG